MRLSLLLLLRLVYLNHDRIFFVYLFLNPGTIRVSLFVVGTDGFIYLQLSVSQVCARFSGGVQLLTEISDHFFVKRTA